MRFTRPQWRPSAAKRRSPPRNVLEVSAFASVMLALLALLMGPSFQVDFPMQFPVDVPPANHSTSQPDAQRDDALVIGVARDGTVFFRNHKVSAADLPDLLRQAVHDGAENTVYIRADARAKYADVNSVLDQIRQSGLQNVTFLTEHPNH